MKLLHRGTKTGDGRLDPGWMLFGRPGPGIYPTRGGLSYKDTPYSVPRINVVRERRGPRRHLSLLELIKAESAAR